MAYCPPHTLVKVRAGFRAGEVAGWACTIAITCSEFHKRREKSRRLGWAALTDGPVSMCRRACVARGEREASGAYADAQALQHEDSSLGAARMNPRRVGDSVKLRSTRVLLACAGERADVKMPLE